LAWVGASAVLAPSLARAQAYPERPIRMVLGVAPGGLIDVTARLVASHLGARLGQSIIVDNRPGANTTIAANLVVQAPADGYTLFYGGAMSASPIFVKNNAVDFLTQLKPVSMVVSAPFYLLVSAKVPAKTFEELVAWSKQKPGKLNFADGAATSTMLMHAFAGRTGLDFTPIPYKGSAPSLAALLSGEVDMSLDTVPNYVPHIERGTIRALLNSTGKRSAVLPNVPAATEIKGVDFTAASNLSLWAPRNTPDSIIRKLSTEIAALARNPEFVSKYRAATNNLDPVLSSPDELYRWIDGDRKLYSDVARQMKYEPQ
jgi:tripartite-type tricarboxylate transporter receptor subunit TctC